MLNAIDALVASASAGEEVLCADEADLDLNPRIGLGYIGRVRQALVLTAVKKVKRYLESLGGRFVLHFLPPHPRESSPIERLRKQLHDHFTPNHRHAHIGSLLADVETFLSHARPLRGDRVSSLQLAASTCPGWMSGNLVRPDSLVRRRVSIGAR